VYGYDAVGALQSIAQEGRAGFANHVNGRYELARAKPDLFHGGNLSSDGVHAYVYDALNRQIQASRPGMTANYGYDPLGRRTWKVVNGASTRYIYDGQQRIAEVDGTCRSEIFGA
jgi:YD repeat-containing protein